MQHTDTRDGTAPTPIGNRVLALLDGRRQAWLATSTGLHRSTITRIIRGQRQPTLPVLERIARALLLPVDRLVDGTDAEATVSAAPAVVPRAQVEGALAEQVYLREELEAAREEARRLKLRGHAREQAALRAINRAITLLRHAIVSLDQEAGGDPG